MASLQLQNPSFETPLILVPEAATALGTKTIDLSQPGLDGAFSVTLPSDFTPFLVEGVPGWEIFDPAGVITGEAKPLPNAQDIEAASEIGVVNSTVTSFKPISNNPARDGQNSLYVFSADQPGIASAFGVRQVLDSVLLPSTQYDLNVSVGNPDFENPNELPPDPLFPFPVDPSSPLEGFPGYRVELLAGDSLLAFDENSQTIEEGIFERISLSYLSSTEEVGIGERLEVRLLSPVSGIGAEVHFDNASITATAVPEGIPIVGFMIALSGLLTYRRIRRWSHRSV